MRIRLSLSRAEKQKKGNIGYAECKEPTYLQNLMISTSFTMDIIFFLMYSMEFGVGKKKKPHRGARAA